MPNGFMEDLTMSFKICTLLVGSTVVVLRVINFNFFN